MSNRVLLVEDDALFGETIAEYLEDLGYEVAHHLDASSAIDATFAQRFSLYVLDVQLPSQNGIDLLYSLRASGDMTPALYLTSSQAKETLTAGFAAGCDDFLTKPVDLEELRLRIKALMRRTYGDSRMTFGQFVLDSERQTLMRGSEVTPLKPKAFALLQLLLSQKGRTVTIEQIQERLYTHAQTSSNGAIRVYLNEIKRAIGEEFITNIRGIGYRFDA
ncbi:MAG: hypothetical protein KU37_04765 [Sulfuricurvum sp. PC08-66]|nr:MAG: hypothetical protein KU37_04765 [Sulfuricurvum sp. PC08-66]